MKEIILEAIIADGGGGNAGLGLTFASDFNVMSIFESQAIFPVLTGEARGSGGNGGSATGGSGTNGNPGGNGNPGM
jgi:hypothetical protein